MSETIEDILKDINTGKFLPGIQREFVWEPKDIEELFDSIIRDYPIGSIIMWDVKSGDEYQMYKFICNYISDTGRTPTEIEAGKWKRHNERVNTSDYRGSSPDLVLDGQQRLTSINIGFNGSIISYNGGPAYSRTDESQWVAEKLCINLLGHPNRNRDDATGDYEIEFRPVADAYELQQLDSNDKPKDGLGYYGSGSVNKHWVPLSVFVNEHGEAVEKNELLGKLLPLSDDYDAEERDERIEFPLYDDEADKYDHWSETTIKEVVDDVINTITSYEIEFKDKRNSWQKEEVRDIFNRINTKGQSPKPYQLLMSQLMSYWPYYGEEDDLEPLNPREEVEEIVEKLRKNEEYGSKIDRKVVIQTICYISGVSLRRSEIEDLAQKDEEKIAYIRRIWSTNGLKKSLNDAMNTLVEIGFTPKSMDIMPIVSLLGMFYYMNGEYHKKPNGQRRNYSDTHNEEVFDFISRILLANESHNITRRSKVEEMAEYLRDEIDDKWSEEDEELSEPFNQFPGDDIIQKFGFRPTKEDIENIYLNARYNSPYEDYSNKKSDSYTNQEAFVILSQIYMNNVNSNRTIEDYEIDHIYPQDISDEVDGDIHTIGNLQLLTSQENNSKSDKLPEDWFEDYYDSKDRRTHRRNWLYPENIGELTIDKYSEFIVKREERIIEDICEKFNIAMDDEEVSAMVSKKQGAE